MKRFLFILFGWLLGISTMQSQSILRYRYWYDNDVSDIQSGLLDDGNLILDVNGMEDGLHNLYVVLEGDALIAPQRYMFVKVSPLSPIPTAELKYRYWFDNDVSDIQTGLLGDGILLLNVDDLEDGLHNLYVVLEGDALIAPQRYMFVKVSPSSPIPTAELRYRYWFDNDVSDIQTGLLGDGILLLNVDDLEDGLHNLYVVLEGDALIAPQRYMFVKVSPSSPIPTAELRYRYWFDNDVSDIQTGLLGDGILLLDIDSLEDGLHNLYVVLESDALVAPQRYMFVKVAPSSPTPTAELKYRYWFDNDVSNIQTGLLDDGILLLDIDSLEDGLHNLYVVLESDALIAPQRYMFVKVTPSTPTPTAELKYRYWFDNNVSDIQTGFLGEGILLLDVDGLEDGLHNLYVVLEGDALMAPQRYMFVKMTSQLPPPTVELKYRYWFDDNVSDIQTGLLGNGSLLLDANALDDGDHTLHIMLEGNCLMMPQSYDFTKNDSIPSFYAITAIVNPLDGGFVTGTGTYLEGETCTLTATSNFGYIFESWTKDGSVVSTSPTYSFTVAESAVYTANFIQQIVNTYYVSASVYPADGGTVTGGGSYNQGSTCTLTATPAQGYFFLNWTHNGNVVSNSPTYSFTVTGNANYTANFTLGLPELHVIGITHSSLMAGQTATISWTIQNDGTAVTPNGALWHDRVWLSVESRVAAGDNNPILLGTFDNLSALAPGEYYTQTQTFTLPLELSGSYYLFVLTDAYDCHTIFWDSTGVQLPYNPPPYLGCWSHHCTGDCPNVADNRIYELSEYEYGNQGYAGGWGYYSDNFFYTLVDIAVPPLPDLQVTGIIPPDNFFSGTNVAVTAYITNTGDHVTYSDHWADALFIASEPDINSPTAVCLDVKQHSTALGAGQSYQVTLSGQVPVTMYGEAYFFVYTDCYNQVYEHVMNNNNITMSNAVNVILTPPADLVPTIVSVPSAVSTAENLTYSFRVTNSGAGSPNVGNWVDKVYLSHNPNALDDNAILLKTHSHHGETAPGAYYTVSETVNLPTGITSGNYYLYVHTDADNAVFEYLYDDNNVTLSSAIEVSKPDLQVAQASVPEQITSGYPLNLSYTLANEGEGAIVNRSVTDKIFVSASGTMANAIMIDSIRRNVSLPAGQSMTVMRNEVIRAGLTDGIYHLLIVTDFDNDINETEEGNNTYSHYPMSVFHQPLPDLQPVSLNLPSVIQAGEAVNVNFDITNIGDMDLLNSNCTFDVYALMGEEEILCPVQSQTLPLGNYVSIGINDTLHFVRSVLVPPTVTSACTTFQLIANKGNQIMELDTTNNTFVTNATVLDCPLPDLAVSNVVLPALQAGIEAQVSFTVNNNGTAVFEGSFGTAIYTIFEADTIFCPMRLQLSPEISENYGLAIGESLQFTQKILVPPSVTSSFNTFYVMVDAENTVLESNEDNNITGSVTSVTNYPFNLTTQNFTVPSTVIAGELTSVTWTVKNTGTCPNGQIPFYIKNGNGYSLVEGEYLPTPWKDMVFLSNDALLSNNDIQLLSVDHNMVLQPNGTYQMEQNVVLPYNALGSKYLLCVSDSTQVTFDNNRVDNILAVPVEVELGVLPDLRITSLTVESVMTSDNAYWVHYTVTNEGERVTQRDNWVDAFYISETYAVTGAFQLGSKIHNGALEVGESYTDSIEILAPNGLVGDYFLLGFTDATNLIYEHENEDDNVMAASVMVVAPDPCDLIAVQPDFPNSLVSGEDMTVSWQLRNIGSNPAIGRIRNAVYLSADAEWSSDDKMLGYADMNINIAANGEQSFELSGSITGFDEGSYYVIVKVNILNALNESTYENNVCVSMVTTEITFPTLAIGETIQRTIFPERNIYYKIEVDAEYEGQTMLCRLESLNHDLTVANGIYLSHGSVPTSIDFDYGQFVPYSYEQEILIPALEQGTYYLMVQGAAFQVGQLDSTVIHRNLVPVQNISISASIVNFEILSVNASHGSNTGSVTTKVTGAKFEDVMDIRLVQGDEYLPAQKVYVNNSSEAYVTFDLTEMPLGNYDVEAELPGGVITVKEDAFIVEEGLPSELMLRLLVPASVRNGNTFPITLEYGNTGFTDLNVIGFKVVSRNGHPIGTTAEELQEGKTERIVYVRDSGTHYLNGMNPGYLNNKVLIMKATPASNIKLSVFAIRRQ